MELEDIAPAFARARPEPRSARPSLRGLACAGYLLLVAAISAYQLVRWPIAAGDTDVWFHLNTGRFIWGHHGLPSDTSFFSFLSPPRPLVDYSWLFQAVLYKIWSSLGYGGLIALRTLIGGALLAGVGWILFRASRNPRARRAWSAAFVFALYATLLVPHTRLLRPQLCTDVGIVLCLGLLERKPQWAAWLPPAAWLWTNSHGIFYPVLLLILGAYAAEFIWARRRGTWRGLPPEDPRPFPLPAVVAAMLCVFVTPYGLRLLPIPFERAPRAFRYIQEFAPLTPAMLSTLELRGGLLSTQSAFNLLALLSLASVSGAASRGRLRTSHLLLALGSVPLLTRGARFMFQGALLWLPLLAEAVPAFAEEMRLEGRAPALRLAAAAVLTLPPVSLWASFPRPPRYPVSEERLPRGVAAFLDSIEAGGRVLNHPNNGGFLEWTLSPAYKIAMDMRVPQVFGEDDFLAVRGAYLEAGRLGRFLEAYAPSFITVPLTDGGFPARISRFPDYVPVFFDDAEALYVDRRRQPAVALAYALTELDPFALARGEAPRLNASPAANAALRKELARMLLIDGHCLATRQLAAQLALGERNYSAALPHARALEADFPELPIGFRLEGRSREGLGQWQRSVVAFEAAYDRAADAGAAAAPGAPIAPGTAAAENGSAADVSAAARADISRELGAVCLRHGRYDAAYGAFRRALGARADSPDASALYPAALSAALSGRAREAARLVDLLARIPGAPRGGAAEWRRRLARDVARLSARPPRDKRPAPAAAP